MNDLTGAVIRLNNAQVTSILNGLQGKMAHVTPEEVFEGIDWHRVCEKPDSAPHSIWEIVNHLVFWQNYSLKLIQGVNHRPMFPKHAFESWVCSVAPHDERQWTETVHQFLYGLNLAKESARVQFADGMSIEQYECRMEIFESLICHNSYHLGQIVLLRHVLGIWPPPSGGNTW